MNKDKYQELMRRFSQELFEVGVTEEMKSLIKDSLERTPNLASCQKEESVGKFSYRHNGYLIEAERTVRVLVKKCN